MGSKTSLSFRGVAFFLLENERFFVFFMKKEKKQNSPGLFHTLKEKSTRRRNHLYLAVLLLFITVWSIHRKILSTYFKV